MTTSFWNSWQLWEKLCFVLGCAIVFVICLGCLKLLYNHWSLRRYIKIDAAKAAIKQEMQHSKSVKRGRANQVPFGVRAIESGIEVDGVWISRLNTPASSLPGSPALSSISSKQTESHPNLPAGRTSTATDMTRLEISQPAYGYPDADLPSSSSSTTRNPFDRPPPTSDHQTRGRPTYQPRRSSGLRYSNSFDPEDPEDLPTPEDHSMSTKKDGKQPERFEPEYDERRPSVSTLASSGSSRNGASHEESRLEPATNGFLHPEYNNPPKGRTSTAYELSDIGPNMVGQSSRVAEMGQPHIFSLPNGKANPHSPIQNAAINGSSRSSYEANNPFVTPDGSLKDYRAESLQNDDDIADQHTRLIDDSGITYDEDYAKPLQPFDNNRHLRHSQVIRKVNSGFQILRPGTLEISRQSNNDDKKSTGVFEETNKRAPKKLQKKGRPSSTSSYALEE